MLNRIESIMLKTSPPNSLQRSCKSERFMQELSVRECVIRIVTVLPATLWAEAIHHGNWLRNRPPSKRRNKNLPFPLWRPNANIINFVKLPINGQPGFAYIYCPSMAANMKLFARSSHICFAVIESDENLCRTNDPVAKKVFGGRVTYFKPCR